MKKEFVLFLILFFSPLNFAFAALEINEIMYDLPTGSDSGREWVEVFNNSAEEADFANLKFFEADTNHKLVLKEGNGKIPAMGYAVIVSDATKFKNDWPTSPSLGGPTFSGNIFDSTFSLGNSGEVLAIKKEEKIIDQYSYNSATGAAGDGKSLQKINGTWVASVPTPGRENKIVLLPPSEKSLAKLVSVAKEKPKAESSSNFTESEMSPLEPQSEVTSKPPYFSMAGLVFVLLGGVSAIYLVRRKKNDPKAGEDFEILS